MANIQQELRPQPREADDDMDEMYEEEPRRRAWGAIASVILALALVFVGYQWNQAAGRAETLGAQVNGLRAEAETQRLRAEDAQRQVDALQKRIGTLAAEKDTLADRVAALEKAPPAPRAAAAKAEKPRTVAKTPTATPKATPVAGRPTTSKRTP